MAGLPGVDWWNASWFSKSGARTAKDGQEGVIDLVGTDH